MSELAQRPLHELLDAHTCIGEFLASVGLLAQPAHLPLASWLEQVPDDRLLDAGMDRHQILAHLKGLVVEVEALREQAPVGVRSLTIIGGHDKAGRPEWPQLSLHPGEIVCIVGPTGSGKSRLLSDIECLAQGDTPTGRRVLINGEVPDDDVRFNLAGKLVVQLSQNMNFVVDMSVHDFISMHASCRMVAQPQAKVREVIACANALAGEQFSDGVSLTQLSGGQARALMIADAALLSASPVVLIDEIENAGVDRKQALDLLVRGEKIVLMSTHDPLLALRGSRRVVIRHGGMAELITTSEREQRNRDRIEAVDSVLSGIRDRLRQGGRMDEYIAWPR